MAGTELLLNTLGTEEGHRMGVRGKVCIITGGGSGIGRGAALMLAEQGAKIALVGRTASKVEAARDEIQAAGGEALAFGLNVADYDDVCNMTQQTLDVFGRVDVLINNAGHSSHHRRILTTPPDEIRAVVDSNLVGTMYCTRACPSACTSSGAKGTRRRCWRRQPPSSGPCPGYSTGHKSRRGCTEETRRTYNVKE